MVAFAYSGVADAAAAAAAAALLKDVDVIFAKLNDSLTRNR